MGFEREDPGVVRPIANPTSDDGSAQFRGTSLQESAAVRDFDS